MSRSGENTRTIVIECMKKVLDSENPMCCTDATRLIDDLGFDSLQFVEFLADLEEKFDFMIPDNDFTMDNFDSLGKVIDYVTQRSATAPAAATETSTEAIAQ
jgi:acyl carrier protein